MATKTSVIWRLIILIASPVTLIGEAGDLYKVDSMQTALAATVRIVTGELINGEFHGQMRGAGVIISAEGTLLTSRQAILMPDGTVSSQIWAMMAVSNSAVSLHRAVKLRVISVNPDLNLALMNVVQRDGRKLTLPFVRLDVGGRIDYGTKVSLLGFSSASSSAVVRRDATVVEFEDRNKQSEWIIVDGDIPQESSGGPVFNQQWNLIGLQATIKKSRQIPFFGDEDFPIGTIGIGDIGYVRPARALIEFLLDPATTSHNLTFQPQGADLKVTGQIRDQKTGEPVSGAVIGMISARDLARTPYFTASELVGYARSNFQGQFEISRRVPRADYLIKVVHPRYQTIVREIAIGIDQRDLIIEMVKN